jgi:hypothetical protein
MQERPFHLLQAFQQSCQSRRGFDVLFCIAVFCTSIVDALLFGRRMELHSSISAEEYGSHVELLGIVSVLFGKGCGC